MIDGRKKYHLSKTFQFKDPDELVVEYLLIHGEARHFQIENMLRENGIRFFDHKGTDYVLQRLIKNRRIIKIGRGRGNPYPLYRLFPTAEKNIALQAKLYAIDASDFLLQRSNRFDDRKKFLLNLTQMIGFYTIFNYIESFKYIEKNSNIKQVEWIENSLPMREVFPNLFGHELGLEYDNKIIHNVEKRLAELFPIEYKECKTLTLELLSNAKWFLNLPGKPNSRRVVKAEY
ncbi:MAG: hypothetical protein ACT4N5_05675 [Nitrosopumilaceae archaeon]